MECNIDCTADVLKAIAHPTRLKLLCALNSRELSVQTLVEETGTTQSNISQHLSVLKERGIVTSRRDTTRIYYRIRDKELLQLITLMRDIYCHKAA
jgi:DNA-binding transcriptional ArsR family regulator